MKPTSAPAELKFAYPSPSIKKRGFALNWFFEQEALSRAMHEPVYARAIKVRREIPPTKEQVAQHARAVALLEELEANPYFDYGYDGCTIVPLLPKVEIEYAETRDEWLERITKLLKQEVADEHERDEAVAVARRKRFEEFAESIGVKLFPWQVDCADALLRGQPVTYGRKSGRAYVQRVLNQFLVAETDFSDLGGPR